MLYRRVPLKTFPQGGFAYALVHEGSNYIEIGLGHESVNGLQLTHVPGEKLHHSWAVSRLDEARKAGYNGLPVGRLREHFGVTEGDLYAMSDPAFDVLAGHVKELRDEVWGHPLDWNPVRLDLCDGRFVWLMYGSEVDKIRIGLGFYDERNEPVMGEAAYAIPKSYAAEFACEKFLSKGITPFFATPINWPRQMDRFVSGDDNAAMAVLLIRMADEVWPGQVNAPAEPLPARVDTPFEASAMISR